MSLISVQNLSLTLQSALFSNLSFVLNEGDRLGIIAANGRGETSLLRLLAGEGEPTQGQTTKARGLKLVYVSQYVPDAFMDVSLHEVVLGGLDAEARDYESWRVDVVLDDLAVPYDFHSLPMHQLSGGWQRLALLARAWVSEPDALLLDEPTNHLDIEKVRLLEAWMGNLPKSVAIVVASHDRAFLDAVTNKSLFLRSERSQLFSQPYSKARVALDEVDASDARQFDRDMKTAQNLMRQAAKLKNIGINSGSDLLTVKTSQLKARAAKIEENAKAAYQERSAGKIRLDGHASHAKALIVLDQAEVTTPDGRAIFKTGNLWINPGDHIILLGENGAGKSCFLELIRQAIINPDAVPSSVKATPSLVLGYSDQALSQIRGDWTPFAIVTRQFEVGDQRAHSLLAGAGISVDLQDKPAEKLSGGQRARLAMLCLRLANPNFYILDEPTNHLDIEGQEALESELLRGEAASLIVSHDRQFVRNVGNRFWMIKGKRLIEIESPDDFFDGR